MVAQTAVDISHPFDSNCLADIKTIEMDVAMENTTVASHQLLCNPSASCTISSPADIQCKIFPSIVQNFRENLRQFSDSLLRLC